MSSDAALSRLSETVHEMRVPYEQSPTWERWVLLASDLHYDNPWCDRKLLRRVFDEARRRDASIFLIGDTFCAMQGRYDPRSDKSKLGPEYRTDDYVDALVREQTKFLTDYADLVKLITYGNHETNILKRLETDLIQRTVGALKAEKPAAKIDSGSYAGWVRFRFHREGSRVRSHMLHYDHGSGGGGPVTKGVIGANRRAVYLPDAQTVASGHIHERWIFPVTRERVDRAGKTYIDEQMHLCLGSFKEERLPGHGFHVERGRPPKPMGAVWMRFYWSPEHDDVLASYHMTER